MIEEKVDMYEKGAEFLKLGLKIAQPQITDKEAESIIINIGNYLQLKNLQKKQNDSL